MSQCNYCTLKNIRRDAKSRRLCVTLLDDAQWGMRGTNIYIHPRELKIVELGGGEDGERAKYRVAWMAELTNHCVC